MPSKKRTRKQKIVADQRRQQPASGAYSYSLQDTGIRENILTNTSTTQETHRPATRTITIDTQHYQFLKSDLRKTLLLTLAIIVTQVILFFVTQ